MVSVQVRYATPGESNLTPILVHTKYTACVRRLLLFCPYANLPICVVCGEGGVRDQIIARPHYGVCVGDWGLKHPVSFFHCYYCDTEQKRRDKKIRESSAGFGEGTEAGGRWCPGKRAPQGVNKEMKGTLLTTDALLGDLVSRNSRPRLPNEECIYAGNDLGKSGEYITIVQRYLNQKHKVRNIRTVPLALRSRAL